jgi:nucleotide-binding universal stress UspA family protein
MIHFAYDGTIHGDWVSHYAVRLAAHHPSRELHLVHIDEQTLSTPALEERIAAINAQCQRAGVRLRLEICGLSGDVFSSLQARLPAGPETLVVCGTRTRRSRSGLLSGTVSERLLQSNRFHVLALRIMQPGLLGLPRDFLLPVSGRPQGFRGGLPFLRLFAPDISRIHILHVCRVARWHYRVLTDESVRRLSLGGGEYCRRIENEISQELRLDSAMIDTSVIVSDDVPKEIVIFANKVRSRLIYLGASERTLPQRFFYGNPTEQILRDASCDVAVYRGLE